MADAQKPEAGLSGAAEDLVRRALKTGGLASFVGPAAVRIKIEPGTAPRGKAGDQGKARLIVELAVDETESAFGQVELDVRTKPKPPAIVAPGEAELSAFTDRLRKQLAAFQAAKLGETVGGLSGLFPDAAVLATSNGLSAESEVQVALFGGLAAVGRVPCLLRWDAQRLSWQHADQAAFVRRAVEAGIDTLSSTELLQELAWQSDIVRENLGSLRLKLQPESPPDAELSGALPLSAAITLEGSGRRKTRHIHTCTVHCERLGSACFAGDIKVDANDGRLIERKVRRALHPVRAFAPLGGAVAAVGVLVVALFVLNPLGWGRVKLDVLAPIGVTERADEATLRWRSSISDEEYEVEIWNAGDPQTTYPLAVTESGGEYTATTRGVVQLDYGQSYQWRVLAKGAETDRVYGPYGFETPPYPFGALLPGEAWSLDAIAAAISGEQAGARALLAVYDRLEVEGTGIPGESVFEVDRGTHTAAGVFGDLRVELGKGGDDGPRLGNETVAALCEWASARVEGDAKDGRLRWVQDLVDGLIVTAASRDERARWEAYKAQTLPPRWSTVVSAAEFGAVLSEYAYDEPGQGDALGYPRELRGADVTFRLVSVPPSAEAWQQVVSPVGVPETLREWNVSRWHLFYIADRELRMVSRSALRGDDPQREVDVPTFYEWQLAGLAFEASSWGVTSFVEGEREWCLSERGKDAGAWIIGGRTLQRAAESPAGEREDVGFPPYAAERGLAEWFDEWKLLLITPPDEQDEAALRPVIRFSPRSAGGREG